MPLDRTRPYAEVYGAVGIAFEQDGRCYNAGGHRVERGEDGKFHAVPDDDATAAGMPEPKIAAPADYGRMSNDKLKAALAIYGGEWRGRSAAIAILEGRA